MTQPTTPRAALVTGGSSGIGLAVARTLLDDGYRVTICGRTPERLDAAVSQLAGVGDQHRDVSGTVADVADPAAADALLAAHVDRFGRLDVLVNNAGTATLGAVGNAPVGQLDDMMTANVRSAWLVTAAATPLLRKAGAEHGRALVVTVSSVLGRYGQSLTAAYSASKAALFALTQSIHDELAPAGVRATTVAPAYVATPLTEPLAHLDRDQMIRPEDVAEAVRFLTRLGPTAAVPDIQLFRTADRLLDT